MVAGMPICGALEEEVEENQKSDALTAPLFTHFRKSGEPSRTRTCDPLVKSQLLYRLSYRPTNLKQSKVSSIKFQVDGSEVANSLSLWDRVGVRDEVSANTH